MMSAYSIQHPEKSLSQNIATKTKQLLPSLFLPHGAPDLPVSGHAAAKFLLDLGASLPRPKGIVIISAHWESRGLKLTAAKELETIYDFYGFDPMLRSLKYPAKTKQSLIEDVMNKLGNAGFEVTEDTTRGLDHGAWVPLMLLFPKADIPVVQLSLDMDLTPEQLVDLGHALAPLHERNILVIGSGGTVHNLQKRAKEETSAPDWALTFDDWIDKKLSENDMTALANFEFEAPNANIAHPTPEHLLPLLVAAGAGGDPLVAKKLHSSFSYGSIGMSAWAFGHYET